MAGALGLYTFCFADFGKHMVTDKNGETLKVGLVSHISNEEEALVTTHEDHLHGLEDGEHVTFVEV